MNQKHRKNMHHMRRFATIFAILTLIFCVAGCSKKTPREALEGAYEKTFIDNNPTESFLGLSDINTHLSDNKAYSAGFSLRIQELSGEGLDSYAGMLSGLGLSVDSASDLLNRKSATSMDITYGGTTYLTLGGQLQGSKIHITAPQLLNGSLSVDLSTMKEDLASDSMIGKTFQQYGISLPENFTEELLQSLTAPSTLHDMVALTAACDDLDNSILVEKLDKKSVSFSSDIAYKTAYSVTIPKDAYMTVMNAALDASMEYSSNLSESLTGTANNDADAKLQEAKVKLQEIADTIGDLNFTVAVTKAGYISYAETKITDAENSYSFKASFTGEAAPLADVDVFFQATVKGKTLEATYEESFDTETNEIEFAFTAKENDTTLLTVSGEGAFTDVEKSKKYVMDLDYLEIETKKFSLSFAGDYYVDTTKCDISAPTGTEYNLLRMSDQDFLSLALEVYSNLQKDPLLSNVLNLLGLGM